MLHKYKLFESFMVVDVNSGAVHVVDELVFELLGDAQTIEEFQILDPNRLECKYTSAKINEGLGEINSLFDDGMIFSGDPFVNYKPDMEAKPILKSLCLHICHDCNLRCQYCFAGTGDFGGTRSMMTLEVGKKAIDLLIKESANRRNLEVDFFGGEPLMNFQVVKDIVAYAKSKEALHNKNFRFTLTTNALLLDEYKMDYINENMDNVVLSIDGRKETNDKMRKCIDGSGSYDVILPRIKKMVEKRGGERYYVRGTFTRDNMDFAEDALHLADQGFNLISVEPVVANKDSGIDLREEDLPILFAEYEKLAFEYNKRNITGDGFKFFHFMIDLNQGPCIAKRTSGCGAGHEYAAVTPDGDLYPCHQFVGQADFKIGDVFNGIVGESIRKLFKCSNIYTKKECGECWAKFYCSGGCAANSWQFNQEINSVYYVGCELEKKRVECALWLKGQGNEE